jgi:hypothetical protein
MINQIHIGTTDRRKVVRIIVDNIPPTALDVKADGFEETVTDEMIAEAIHPRQKLNLTVLWGRQLHITERDQILDLRDFAQHAGFDPERTIRAINKDIRALTGMTPM